MTQQQQERMNRIQNLTMKESNISPEEARILISDVSNFVRQYLLDSGFDSRAVKAIATKFRDAGRRSPPWRPASGRVPGRPQDGTDGNRQPRWNFPPEHKFYADEVTATLVEVRYFWQLLSMKNAPSLPQNTLQDSFTWLTKHRIEPDAYQDPIQLISIDIFEVAENPRLIQSGHLIPLDRGGRHEPSNTFLILASSNQLQGNLTLEELLDLMQHILERHGRVAKR